MRIVIFAHSLVSCWNHGNAHFLRGVMRELVTRGHHVLAASPRDGWSIRNMREEPRGAEAERDFPHRFPGLAAAFYDGLDIAACLDAADVVIVHEWTDPAVIARIGRARANGASFVLLFHDTHHRAVSDPNSTRAIDLSGYDAVLAFGEALAGIYRDWDFPRVHVWHEAADTALFKPPAESADRAGLVWIGNWGDDERTAELDTFLLQPAQGIPLDIYGVRYPGAALTRLREAGATYHGWLPNVRAPAVFARHVATIHVPRRFYAQSLPGIPTIRVFEALACGIPLICAPWQDTENLFRPGTDYLQAGDGTQMRRHIHDIINDPALRQSLAASGLGTIQARHTCAHRADELLDIIAAIRIPAGKVL